MEHDSQSLKTIAALFALSPDAVAGVRSGKTVFANEAAEKMFGGEVQGRRLGEMLPDLVLPPEGESFVTAAEIGGGIRTVTGVWYEDCLILTFSREEAHVPAVSPAMLSRMRTAAFNLRFSVDRLLSRDQRRDGPYASILYHNYHSLLHLIEQLSDAGALARGDLFCRNQTLDLAEAVRDLVNSVDYFLPEGGVELTCSVPEEACAVTADPDRLDQLLLIVLSNSLNHTAPGGHIHVSLRREGRRYVLSMDDDGEGMSGDALGRAFSLEKGSSPEDGVSGAGMGLPIAYGLVRLMGGTMVLQSDVGRGTRVRLTLPADDTTCLRDAKHPAARGPGRILTELSGVLPHQAYRREDME